MSAVELLLTEALDREWEAQSGRALRLEHDVPVRTLLELVLAGIPAGIIAAGRVSGATPEEVVARVRDDLPSELSPWTRRSLERVGALRVPAPLLGPGPEVRALPPASEPVPIGPADIPDLPAPAPQPPAVAEPARRARAPRVGPAVLAAPVGAGIAVAAADVGVPAAAGIGAIAAAVLALVLRGAR